jgi:hypothetical protein
MHQRILNWEGLGCGSREKIVVTGNEDGRREVLAPQCFAGDQRRRQLHGIVIPQTMILGQRHRTVDHQSVYWQEEKVFITVLQETTQGPVSLLLGDASRGTVLRSQGRRHLR